MIRLFSVPMSSAAKIAAARVLDSGYVAQGPEVDHFEAELEKLVGKPVVTVNSGTTALDLAYHLAGIKKGSLVVSTPMTCVATNLPLLHRGAEITWVDVDRYTGLIDKNYLEKFDLRYIDAIVAVSWGGAWIDLNDLSVPIIYDFAHRMPGHDVRSATETRRRLGRSNTELPEFSTNRAYVCHSFQAIKFLTTCDGGALIPPAVDLERARKLRWFGYDRESDEDFRSSQLLTDPGFKYHLNDVAAAIGVTNLSLARYYQNYNSMAASIYHEMLLPLVGNSRLISLRPHDYGRDDFWLYTILVEDRDGFVAYAREQGVECSQVHTRNDRHPAFDRFRAELPGLDFFSKHQVSIPLGFWLTELDREKVIDVVTQWVRR